MDYTKVALEIKDLFKIQDELRLNLKQVKLDLYNNQKKIDNVMKKFPRCYSCGKNRDPKNMVIAQQEDIDDYFDRNEGYCGPEIGEYYCGC